MQTHKDLGVRLASVGIHWGTFQLTSEPILEPPQKLAAAVAAEAAMGATEFIVLQHGETRSWDLRGGRDPLEAVEQ